MKLAKNIHTRSAKHTQTKHANNMLIENKIEIRWMLLKEKVNAQQIRKKFNLKFSNLDARQCVHLVIVYLFDKTLKKHVFHCLEITNARLNGLNPVKVRMYFGTSIQLPILCRPVYFCFYFPISTIYHFSFSSLLAGIFGNSIAISSILLTHENFNSIQTQ